MKKWKEREVIEVIPSDKEEEDPRKFNLDEEPEISLNAITGAPSPKTIRIVGVLRNQQVIILIDLGSTHNFVDAQLVAMLGIVSSSMDVVKVRIANDQIISSLGRSEDLSLKMQGNIFKVDCIFCPWLVVTLFWVYNG